MSSMRTPWALRMDTNECRSSLWCPLLPQAGGLGDDGELAADLPTVQWRAVLAAEHQAEVLPGVARTEAFGGLTGPVLLQGFDGAAWAA